MINKQLNDITWADLELLKETGREEDDRIEYKAAFSGGPDYLTLNDKQRQEANVAIAKEVVAFLNGRGGDVLIGVKEASNSHPKIESFPLVPNADQIANRLAASLSALIEPAQSIVNLRVVKPAGQGSSGVIVIRAPSSLRAPHRVMNDRECYVRRGSSSTPMAMEEIQERSVTRYRFQSERIQFLKSHLFRIADHRTGRIRLSESRCHLRLAFLPLTEFSSDITINLRQVMDLSEVKYFRDEQACQEMFPIDGYSERWTPMLRGERSERMRGALGDRWHYWSKEIYRTGMISFDFACHIEEEMHIHPEPVFFLEWVEQFFVYAISAFNEFSSIRPDAFPALIGSIFYNRPIRSLFIDMGLGAPKKFEFEQEVGEFPFFEVHSNSELNQVFYDLISDLVSFAGARMRHSYRLAD